MRVISGKSKGHNLKSPKGLHTRPTVDRIKESLFNIINDINNESIALDLFSGSGSIGIEFLSRGAKKCFFIDNRPDSIDIIKENLSHTKLSELGIVIKSDAFQALKNFAKKNIKFNYIFLDPPFGKHELLLKIVAFINNNKILSSSGLLIIEHESSLLLNEKLYDFKKIRLKNYGNETISFYKYSFEGGI